MRIGSVFMDYMKQKQVIVNYFKDGEKKVDDFKIGVEFEHFVIDLDSLETISYYGQNGVGETLREMEALGYHPVCEGKYILGLEKGKKTITLEPGSQLELSIEASKDIKSLEKEYLEFLNDIIGVLEKKNQGLITTGYHPVTKISEIKLLPKQRYDFMFNYFKTRGSHAHNMMKGTAAFQVSMDYKSEKDYIKKFRVTNALSPVLFALFENAYYYEGQVSPKHNIRSHIWINCDSDRSGIVYGALENDFSYEKYAEYVLDRPPIFINSQGKEIFTGKKKVKELLDPESYQVEELEHLLTMFFPDVRTKGYIEIRMMDAVPYPLNFAIMALLKGLIYNDENLEEIYNYVEDITIKDVNRAKRDMLDLGLKTELNQKTLLDIGRYLVKLSKRGLSPQESKYLIPLEEMLDKGINPYEITKNKAELGKREALQWCILNNIVGDKQ